MTINTNEDCPHLRIVNNEYIVFCGNQELMNFGNHFYSETDAHNYMQRLKLEDQAND